MLRRVVRRLYNLASRSLIALKSISKIWRAGGYSEFKIAYINRGEILCDKRVLITGGGAGIGLAIAKKFLSEGATVAITGRDPAKLEAVSAEMLTARLVTLCWDIRDVEQVDLNIAKCKELLGGDIDIVVNNAGIVRTTDFPNVSPSEWDDIYLTNHKGLFFLSQAICKEWLRDRHFDSPKKLINISSQGGFVGATYPYRMTKWDVAGLTQGLGAKLAPHGILVNGIAPGIIATAMQQSTLKQGENNFSPHNPLERFALPEEIAELALFLASDAANFIVGHTIVCDGGYSLK